MAVLVALGKASEEAPTVQLTLTVAVTSSGPLAVAAVAISPRLMLPATRPAAVAIRTASDSRLRDRLLMTSFECLRITCRRS